MNSHILLLSTNIQDFKFKLRTFIKVFFKSLTFPFHGTTVPTKAKFMFKKTKHHQRQMLSNLMIYVMKNMMD